MTGLVPDYYLLRRDLRYRTSAAAPPPSARSVSVAGSGDGTHRVPPWLLPSSFCAATGAARSNVRIAAEPSHNVRLLVHCFMAESPSASVGLRIREPSRFSGRRSNLAAKL